MRKAAEPTDRAWIKRASLLNLLVIAFMIGQVLVAGTALAAPYSGGLSPYVIDGRADLNGDGVVNGKDDSNAFFGSTGIIDGYVDCNAWGATVNSGAAGNGVINTGDSCTLVGYDGSSDGVTIKVRDGELEVSNGYLPTVWPQVGDADNPSVAASKFAWSTIDGRVDSNGNEIISADDCTLGIIGVTDSAGPNGAGGYDVLGNDSSNANPCGFGSDPSDDSDGLVDLNDDVAITTTDDCTNACFFGHNVIDGVVQVAGSPVTPPTTAPPANVYSGGFSPTLISSRADVNGDGVVDGKDDANAFYGDTHIIDGYLDCDDWASANEGSVGTGTINLDDDCTLVGYDGTVDGRTITVLDGEFETTDGPLPMVFNAGDPDNASVADSDFAWSTINGRVDSNGDELISSDECHLGMIGTTDSAGPNGAGGYDILGNDSADSDPCGFGAPAPGDATDGLVDLDDSKTITSADTCADGCFFGHDVKDGFVLQLPSLSINDVASSEDSASAVFTVTRSGSPLSAVNVDFSTAGGTATSGSDFTANSGTLTFAASDLSETVTVTVINDSIDESTEAFTVGLSSPTNHAVISDASGAGTIADNDPPPPPGGSLPGIVRGGNNWFLRNTLTAGAADSTFGYGNAGDIQVFGDWDGDGDRTAGVVRNGIWHLNNANDSSAPEFVFTYGNPGDIPLVGDWDGDGDETPGVVRGTTLYLRNSNTGGIANLVFSYGNPGDTFIVGDWDGNATDTIGVVRSASWYLRNTNGAGVADVAFGYGLASDTPLAGDWDGDGTDTPAIFRSSNATWHIRNANSGGAAEYSFGFGNPGDTVRMWTSS